MPDTPDQRALTVLKICLALETLADALARVDLDAVLEAEAGLAGALHDLPRVPGGTPVPDEELRREIARARAALVRCRRLGMALDDFARLTLQAVAPGHTYDRGGRERPTLPGGGLHARV